MGTEVSQTTDVIEYIRDHGSITTKQATEELGCYRLSARICDMRAFGIHIEKEMVTVKNRKGEPCRVAKYTIPGGVPECFTA